MAGEGGGIAESTERNELKFIYGPEDGGSACQNKKGGAVGVRRGSLKRKKKAGKKKKRTFAERRVPTVLYAPDGNGGGGRAKDRTCEEISKRGPGTLILALCRLSQGK